MALPSAKSAIEAAFTRHAGLSIILLIWAVVIAVAQFGGFRPVDDAIRDVRFSLDTRAPSGKLVFVDIDSRSISAVGVWPWPRGIHGKLLDKLMADEAANVAFDVDFSLPSTAAQDTLFAASLEAAGG